MEAPQMRPYTNKLDIYVIPVCASLSVTVRADELAPYPILVLARTYK